eukprot:IDg21723t1
MASNIPEEAGEGDAGTRDPRTRDDEFDAPVAPALPAPTPVMPVVDTGTLAHYFAQFQAARAPQNWLPSSPAMGQVRRDFRWGPAAVSTGMGVPGGMTPWMNAGVYAGNPMAFSAPNAQPYASPIGPSGSGFPAMGHPMMYPYGMVYPGLPMPGYVAPSNQGPPAPAPGFETDVPGNVASPAASGLNPYGGVVRPVAQRGRTRPAGWHFGRTVVSRASSWGVRIPCSPDASKGPGDAQDRRRVVLRPRWFMGLEPMRKGGVTLFAFGPWFSDAAVQHKEALRDYRLPDGDYPGGCGITQDVVESSYYQRGACISHRDFRHAGSRSSVHPRRATDVRFAQRARLYCRIAFSRSGIALHRCQPAPGLPADNSGSSRREGDKITGGRFDMLMPNRRGVGASLVTVGGNPICLRMLPCIKESPHFANYWPSWLRLNHQLSWQVMVTEWVAFVAVAWLEAIYTRFRMYRLSPAIIAGILNLDYTSSDFFGCHRNLQDVQLCLWAAGALPAYHSRPPWAWLDRLSADWTVDNPDLSRVAPILVRHATVGYVLRPGELRPGRKDNEAGEVHTAKSFSWRDFGGVGLPTYPRTFSLVGAMYLNIKRVSAGMVLVGYKPTRCAPLGTLRIFTKQGCKETLKLGNKLRGNALRSSVPPPLVLTRRPLTLCHCQAGPPDVVLSLGTVPGVGIQPIPPTSPYIEFILHDGFEITLVVRPATRRKSTGVQSEADTVAVAARSSASQYNSLELYPLSDGSEDNEEYRPGSSSEDVPVGDRSDEFAFPRIRLRLVCIASTRRTVLPFTISMATSSASPTFRITTTDSKRGPGVPLTRPMTCAEDMRYQERDLQMCSYPPPGRAWGIWSGLQDGPPRLASEVITSEDRFRRFYYREARHRAALMAYRQALQRGRPVIDRAHYAAALASWRSRGQGSDVPPAESGVAPGVRGMRPVSTLPAPVVSSPALAGPTVAPAGPGRAVLADEDEITPRGVPTAEDAASKPLEIINVDAGSSGGDNSPASAPRRTIGGSSHRPRTRQRKRVDSPGPPSPAPTRRSRYGLRSRSRRAQEHAELLRDRDDDSIGED